MERFSRQADDVSATAGLELARLAVMVDGVVLIGGGIVMTGSIVMLPAGIVVGAIGIATFIAGAMFGER